jgi:hypothetical protein
LKNIYVLIQAIKVYLSDIKLLMNIGSIFVYIKLIPHLCGVLIFTHQTDKTLEAIFSDKKNRNMRREVACSRGTEWMVSSYNKWQVRSPLPVIPEKDTLTLIQFFNRIFQKEQQFERGVTLSFRSILLIPGLPASVKSK